MIPTASGGEKQIYKRIAVPALIGLFFVCVILFYAVIGGDARFEVHDDLDLFPSQYLILKQTGTFFAHGIRVPFLGGIDRDYLPSEFSLVSLCYMLLPGLAAHVAMYLCKVAIAVAGSYLLAREVLLNSTWLQATDAISGKQVQANETTRAFIFSDMSNRVLLCSFAYGVLNLFPHFGIAFASLPLLLFLLLKIIRAETVKQAKWWYAPLFLYPFVSYFSYFGFFILAYMAVLLVCLLVRYVTGSRAANASSGRRGSEEKTVKPPVPFALALVVLSAGFVVFEYRLFRVMLFSGVPSIREVMGQAEVTITEALSEAWSLFWNGQMHTTSVHKFFVIPVCIIYILMIFIQYNVNRKSGGKEQLRLGKPARAFLFCLALVVFHSLVGGLALYRPFRAVVETILPVLKGFQFNRVYFFNPFLWYLMLCIAVCDMEKRVGTVAAVLACAVALLVPVPYNSLFYSAYEQYYRMHHDGQPTGNLTYGDFYATDLFETAKADIGYEASEYAIAYGFYPAVLQYNGISTLDGYLGYYPLAYKELFRKVIEPDLELDEQARDYFDRFGGRCFLQPGPGRNGDMQFRNADLDPNLYIDADALRKELGCRYVFSRVEVENADALGLRLLQAYENAKEQSYSLYIYVVE